MSGGFTYMTDERVKDTQWEMVQRYSELKKRRELTRQKLKNWEYVFQGAWNALSNMQLPQNFRFSDLPEKQEIVAAWDEYESTSREIAQLRGSFQTAGLNIE